VARVDDDHLRPGFFRVQHGSIDTGWQARSSRCRARTWCSACRCTRIIAPPQVLATPAVVVRMADPRLVGPCCSCRRTTRICASCTPACCCADDPTQNTASGPESLRSPQKRRPPVDRLLPARLLPLAVDQLHRRLQPSVRDDTCRAPGTPLAQCAPS
jgi:hypothetical protein